MIWRMYYEKRGGHVHCALFAGPQEGALGKMGDLCMCANEFTEFTQVKRVLPIDFRRVTGAGGKPLGDDDTKFAEGCGHG